MSKGTEGKNESNGKTPSDNSLVSHNPNSHASRSLILPPRGDYQTLLSYQKSEVVYQITYRFCQRFLKKGDRTIDQMVQAARSGKQNIVEGSKAATTSKEMEIKLTNVARASLEELKLDYEDYLLRITKRSDKRWGCALLGHGHAKRTKDGRGGAEGTPLGSAPAAG